MLDIKNMFCDPADSFAAPGKIELLLPSDGYGLNAMILNAVGDGLRPLAILLHGFPGNERNLDLAESLRAAGPHFPCRPLDGRLCRHYDTCQKG